ncbi:hypothetical protein GJ744_011504 [Endocarpon pusillum]|uniref:Kelch repeat-containing protein n=1 Tax=Endocarpon pusillum TaxID=364733 RepID=A0A8H7AKB4_9EURO|nr:hypothetical protein GJ744_011504 [Endocarpon pusillum]
MQGTMSRTAVVLAFFIPLSFAQSAITTQSNVTFCNWAGLRSGIIRDTIYLDGGGLWWQSATDSHGLPVPVADEDGTGRMFTLNLSYAFNTSTFNETTSLLQPLSKTSGTAGNNIAPDYEDGALFANEGEFYLYGGLTRLTDAYTPPDAQAVLGYEAYRYGPERIIWSRGFIQENLPDSVTRYVSNGASASAPSENLGFYFSGLRGARWGPTTESTRDWYLSDKLIEVDMSTMRGEQWSNNTLPDYIPPRAGAELVWIPVGGRGALVAIGGMTAVEYLLSSPLNSSQSSIAEEQAPGFMTSLPVYDIVSQTWYMQNTTGDGPAQLTSFCSVVAPARDASSFNIYVYGGYDGLNYTSVPFDDVWILSIPSFRWVKAYSGVRSHGRRGHRCERIYPDQMLIIGGVNPDAQQCLTDGPIQIFNLNTLKFQNLYNPREWAEYAVPDVVTALIGGNGQGGATGIASFSNNTLKSLFQTPYTRTINKYYPYSPASGSPGPSPVPTATSQSSGLAKWVAPVLGVVLGLIVLSIIVVLILLYRRRKILRRKSVTTSHAGSSSNNRILNWVNGMPSQASEHKPDTSDTSTDVDNETHMSSPLVGFSEVGGQQRYEVEAKEKVKPKTDAAEMPTDFNTASNFNDFAYRSGTPDKPSQSQTQSQPSGSASNYSQPQIHGLGVTGSPPISPQSPPYPPNHLHSHNNDSRIGNISSNRSDVPSPYVHPQRPEDVGSRSLTASPSPTSSPARSPDLRAHSKNVSADITPANLGGEGAANECGLQRRPTHQRNISSLSSDLLQLNSPDGALTPDEDARRSRLLSGLASHPVQNQDQNQSHGRMGALDGRMEAYREELVSPQEESTSPAGVERKKTAGKKSSFGEMLDEDEKDKK